MTMIDRDVTPATNRIQITRRVDDSSRPKHRADVEPDSFSLREAREVTTEEGAVIAAQYLEKAAAELRAGDYRHVDVWIDSARPWMPASTH